MLCFVVFVVRAGHMIKRRDLVRRDRECSASPEQNLQGTHLHAIRGVDISVAPLTDKAV